LVWALRFASMCDATFALAAVPDSLPPMPMQLSSAEYRGVFR
jgi:hypothetical protein